MNTEIQAVDASASVRKGFVQHDAIARKGFKGEFDRILRASQDEAVRKAESIVLSMVAA